MKLYFNRFHVSFLWLLLISGPVMAQKQGIIGGINVATVRGESTDQSAMQEDYGLGYSVKYILPFENDEKFSFTVDASFSRVNLERSFGSGMNRVVYQNSFTQSYLGVGLRMYLTNSVNRYNPYNGQILPFVGISIGGLNTVRNSERTGDISAQIATKRPVKDPTQGYKFYEGPTYEVNGQAEAGIVYVISKEWALEASGLARPGFSDTWDGIEGTGKGKDWFVSGGMAVQFRF